MRRSTRLAIPLALAALVSACADGSPTGAVEGPRILARLSCHTDVAAQTTRCTPQGPDASGIRGDVILTEDDAYMVYPAGDTYDDVTEVYTITAAVKNIMVKKIGTSDGVNVSSNGIQVFFTLEPTVFLGSGVVTILNADGAGTFTAANQSYYQYNQILSQNQTSNSKQWQFDVPASVQGFTWNVAISTAVEP